MLKCITLPSNDVQLLSLLTSCFLCGNSHCCRLREERVRRVAEKHAALEAEKKRKVQEVREEIQQLRSLQVKKAREMEVRERIKRHKEVCTFLY